MDDGYPKNIRFRRRAFYVKEENEWDFNELTSLIPKSSEHLTKNLVGGILIREKLHHDSSMWLCTINDTEKGLIFFGVGRLNKGKDKYFKKTAKAYAHSRASLQQQRVEAQCGYDQGWQPDFLLSEAGYVKPDNIRELCRAFNENKFPIPKKEKTNV